MPKFEELTLGARVGLALAICLWFPLIFLAIKYGFHAKYLDNAPATAYKACIAVWLVGSLCILAGGMTRTARKTCLLMLFANLVLQIVFFEMN